MDRIYRTVNMKDQETQHYYSHQIQHDARQRCPALIVLKEEHSNSRGGDKVHRRRDVDHTYFHCAETPRVIVVLIIAYVRADDMRFSSLHDTRIVIITGRSSQIYSGLRSIVFTNSQTVVR